MFVLKTVHLGINIVSTFDSGVILLCSLCCVLELKPVKIQQEQSEDESSSSSETNSEDSKETEDKYEPELDLEADFPPGIIYLFIYFSGMHQLGM